MFHHWLLPEFPLLKTTTMKHRLLLIVILLISNHSFSQNCGDILSKKIIAYPTQYYDSVLLNLQVYCPQTVNLENSFFNIVDNNCYIDAYYCSGLSQVISSTNDTIALMNLPQGNYNYTVTIYVSQTDPNQGSCVNYQYYKTENVAFSIGDPTSVTIAPNTHRAIYPNPVSDIINIATENTNNYTIINNEGRTVMNGILNNGNSKVNISHLAPGFYVLQFAGEKPESFKIIKM